RAADRAAAQVHQVPVAGHAVDRAVLAHRRHRDAVAQRKAALLQWLEEGTHVRTRAGEWPTVGNRPGRWPLGSGLIRDLSRMTPVASKTRGCSRSRGVGAPGTR